ncbi:MAG: peptide deformylase [Treponema sp.]|jgi:peptide deformylase|nr:peptide deformylase [Treponema sp.]
MRVLRLENNPEARSDSLLRKKAEPVTDINDELRKTAREMIDQMHAENGVGLAGPQIGLPERIFVTHAAGDFPRVFINPSIIWTSQEQVKYEEGCLSVPGIWADVTRPADIKIQAWNENGRGFTLETSGLLARVILHEYDHLQGILFIDRLPEAKRERILAKLKRQNQAG